MKKYFTLLILFSTLLLSGCTKKSDDTISTEDQPASGVRLVINRLDQDKRPFTVLAQHTSGKLLTFYFSNTSSINKATVDLRYLSGDLLKGPKSTIKFPIDDPYSKAFLLGSCSAGGKCSFDKELSSGSLKLKLKVEGESDTHVLKGDYFFVDGQTTTTDGRVVYSPANSPKKQILINTLGLPKKLDKKIEFYPLAITSTNNQAIKGKLEIKKKGIGQVMIFDGSNYQKLDSTISDDLVTINLNHKPRKKTVTIVRDDLQGKEETHTFYLLGPIVLLSPSN